jgi:type 1 glutamine amidotransferase
MTASHALICCLVISLTLGACIAQGAEPGKTVLLFCGTKGFRHTTCSYGKPIITKLGEESGAFKTICSEDPKVINPEFLSGIDCVILNSTTGPFLDEAQRTALLEYVRNGGGLVGIHAATDALYDWPEYPSLIGGWFDGHPWNEEVTIDVEVPEHPACEGVPNPWKIADEIYQQRNWSRDEVCVLMSLNTQQTDMTKPGIKRQDGDFGIAWCKQFGKGRSFYTALGHRNEVMDDPIYQKHLLGGILWALGVVDGPCTPHPKPH